MSFSVHFCICHWLQ